MKRILVPCDFSEPALQAFQFAVDMAGKSGGEIYLLNVIELPSLYKVAAVRAFQQDYMDKLKADVERKFWNMKEKWAPKEVTVRTIVEFGGLLTKIRDTARRMNADVLVIGTHGAKGLKEYTIGSNTEKLVRTIGVPVVAIKKAAGAIKNIVFPIRPDLDQEALTMMVKELQSFYNATVHVLYVNTPNVFRTDLTMKPELEAFAKRFMLKDFTMNVYNDTSEEKGIINFSREIKADMVAMRTHGRKGLAHLATGSIAEDVVNHVDCPIWTYRVK